MGKNIQTQFLAEAAKLFIGIWCDTDISLICKDRAGELLVVQSWPYPGFPIDILYTLDSASNYSEIQKLKPCLQAQDIPMK